MIAMSIFAVMSVIIMSVYIQTTNTARKMNATRELSETAREITERIAQDVRGKGISMSGSVIDDNISPDFWGISNYTQNWGAILGIGSEPETVMQYIYGKKSEQWLSGCSASDKADPKIFCWLYLIKDSDGDDRFKNAYNLVDSFVPEEPKKRVKITELKFYISWGESTTKKVTLVMTLALMPRIGVPASMIENTKLHIQTTISEQGWKR